MGIPTPKAAVIQGNNTTWRNPRDVDAIVDLLGHDGQFHRYVIPANGKGVIPSEFDRGVAYRRAGVVVQGVAPFLIKEGDEGAKLHEALDVDAQDRKEAEEKAAAAKAAEDRAAVAAAAADLRANNAALKEQTAKAKRAKASTSKGKGD
jgi:hypothetical protein